MKETLQWVKVTQDVINSLKEDVIYHTRFGDLNGIALKRYLKPGHRTEILIPIKEVVAEPKYRVGRSSGRAILEVETGHEYLIFPVGSNEAVQDYCNYLNRMTQQPKQEDQINSKTNCPTCGSEVSIGGDGVTHYYIPKQ
jgi:hypothetical protein